MKKILRAPVITVLFTTACVMRPVVRTETEVLSSLGRTQIETFSARGSVFYSGSQGSQQADFRCSIKGDRFRFTVTGLFGIVVSEAISFGDSLYLYDAFNKIVTVTRPDKSLAPVIGADIVPAEFVNTLLGALPRLDSLEGYWQNQDRIILSFASGFYVFRSRDLALERIERADGTVEFSDFISTAAGPRPRFIRIVAVNGPLGKEKTEITIRSQEVNRPIADELFRFSIPKGVEVQDLR